MVGFGTLVDKEPPKSILGELSQILDRWLGILVLVPFLAYSVACIKQVPFFLQGLLKFFSLSYFLWHNDVLLLQDHIRIKLLPFCLKLSIRPPAAEGVRFPLYTMWRKRLIQRDMPNSTTYRFPYKCLRPFGDTFARLGQHHKLNASVIQRGVWCALLGSISVIEFHFHYCACTILSFLIHSTPINVFLGCEKNHSCKA